MNKVYCTLDPHKLGEALELSQGNLVVSTNQICDWSRMVQGTIAIGVGLTSFEGRFYSTSFPAAGLTNLTSIGICEIGSALNRTVGDEVSADTAAEAMSVGLISAGGLTSSGPGIYAGGVCVVPLHPIAERTAIGVMLSIDTSGTFVSFQANGNYLGQVQLPDGRFWVPAISIGSTDSATDVACYVNFGQRGLDYPAMTLDV